MAVENLQQQIAELMMDLEMLESQEMGSGLLFWALGPVSVELKQSVQY
jgi:hypothetical protein